MCWIYHCKLTWNSTSDRTVRHCFNKIVLNVVFVMVTRCPRSKWQARSQILLRFLERLKLMSFDNISSSITRLFIIISCPKTCALATFSIVNVLMVWWTVHAILGREVVSTLNYSGASYLTPWGNLIDGKKVQDWCTTKWKLDDTLYSHDYVIVNIVILYYHDDVIKWKYFPRYWPFVRWIPLKKTSDAELSCFLSSLPE